MIKVGLIEDDASYRLAVEKVIHFQPETVCLISVESPEAFWAALPSRTALDVIFLDIDFPSDHGIRHIQQIKKRFPSGEIIMLTRFEQPELLFKSLSLGASGYLIKDFDPYKLIDYLHVIKEGGALVSPKMARFLIQYINPPKAADSDTELNVKEIQILRLFADGNTYEETAQVMEVSINAVRYHIKNIYKKLGVNNKQAALKQWRTIDEAE